VLTEYVVTRWYRAPEVMLLPKQYTSALDLWSAGCILCEIIGRKVLFPGKNHVDMIRRITEVLGTPPDVDVQWLPKSSDAHRFLFQVCPRSKGQPLKDLYANASSSALDLAVKMLHWDHEKRISAAEGLAHPYLKSFQQKEDSVPFEPFDWSFDDFKKTSNALRERLYQECGRFHREILERDGYPYGDPGRNPTVVGGGRISARSVTPPSARRTATPPRTSVASNGSRRPSQQDRSTTPPVGRSVTPPGGRRGSGGYVGAVIRTVTPTRRSVTPPRASAAPSGSRSITPPPRQSTPPVVQARLPSDSMTTHNDRDNTPSKRRWRKEVTPPRRD